jgi:hypothetical protein
MLHYFPLICCFILSFGLYIFLAFLFQCTNNFIYEIFWCGTPSMYAHRWIDMKIYDLFPCRFGDVSFRWSSFRRWALHSIYGWMSISVVWILTIKGNSSLKCTNSVGQLKYINKSSKNLQFLFQFSYLKILMLV